MEKIEQSQRRSAEGQRRSIVRPQAASDELQGFWIDLDAEVLWRDGSHVQLRPRTWAVLRHLVRRPGVLVAKEEILNAVWGPVTVTEATLSQSIRELRQALNDDASNPRFIATVHRRGFRFLGGIRVAEGPNVASLEVSRTTPGGRPSAGLLVGRAEALDQLRIAFSRACAGTRQLVLVSGEPGIGKTTLVTAFLDSLGSDVAVGLGGGVSELTDTEPFFPIFDALQRLASGPQRALFSGMLAEFAPSWLQERLGLTSLRPGAGESDEHTSPSRMLLRLAGGIERMAQKTALVLALEDLHWADQGTLDLLALLARGAEPARLLVIATYRPSEAILHGNRLNDLRSERNRDPRLLHLPLPLLSVDDCDSFLRASLGGAEPPDGLVDLLYTYTEGNPLFLATAFDHLVERGWLQDAGDPPALMCSLDTVGANLPTDLVTLVEHETRRLAPDEARVLEAGSVAGSEFSVQEVAAALEIDVMEVERCLEGLASSWRFVRSVGAATWPDDTVGSRWQFVHALHRRAMLDRVSAARLQRWHQRIGERIEAGWIARREEVVTTLATHFEASRDHARALEYLDQAARIAERRCAPADAKAFLSRAIEKLVERAGSRTDRPRELDLRIRMVIAINAMEGYASAELRDQLRRAVDLCVDPGFERVRFRLTFALVASCLSGNDSRVEDHLQDLRDHAEVVGTEGAHMLCEVLSCVMAILEGRYRDAAALEQLIDVSRSVDEDLYVGAHFRVFVPVWSALRRSAIGDSEEARRLSDVALARSRTLPDRHNEVFALSCAAQIAAWDRDRDRLEEIALRSGVLTREYGYHYWGGFVRFLLRRLQVMQDPRPGGFDELKELVDALGVDSSPRRAILFAGLAEAALQERRFAEGFAAIEAGLASVTAGFARAGHSELLRVRAALRRAAGEPLARVREDLEAALAIAEQQGALPSGERVAADLADLARRSARARD